jgi:hypothetical protein
VKKEEEPHKKIKKESFPSNPYRYNLCGSSLQFPSRLPSINKNVQNEEIEERIASLEKVYKDCEETMNEGVDSYWLMRKDLEKKVDGINNRVETLANVVLDMANDMKLLVKVIKRHHDDITELATSFSCITHACNLKREDDAVEHRLLPRRNRYSQGASLTKKPCKFIVGIMQIYFLLCILFFSK